MQVELNDEQQFLLEAAAGAISRDASLASVRKWTEAGDLADADALAVRQGWTGIGLEEDAGGQGGGLIELAVLAEQLGKGAVPWDRTLAMCLASPLLALAGEEGRTLAAANAEGEGVAVLAVDGRRPIGPAPASVLDGDRLTLVLRDVPGAAGASELVVPIDTDGQVALFATAAGDDGVSVTPRPIVDHTRSLADVKLQGAPARALGQVSYAELAAAADAAAVLVAADSLGASERMLELTTQYVGERQQFGVPVGSFQAVKHMAAQMLVDVEASRSAVHHGAWAVSAEEQDARLHAAIAKSQSCSAAARVADRALFLHGAVGYTWEHDLQFFFKRAKSNALVFGSPDAYRDIIAGELALAESVQAPVA
jgi:alkylation response protein AidB-like acyl-CoA dehydrogenase